jgi:hypothetical protein
MLHAERIRPTNTHTIASFKAERLEKKDAAAGENCSTKRHWKSSASNY